MSICVSCRQPIRGTEGKSGSWVQLSAKCQHLVHAECLEGLVDRVNSYCAVIGCPGCHPSVAATLAPLGGRAQPVEKSSNRGMIAAAIVIAGIFLAAVATYCYIRLTDSRDEANLAYTHAMAQIKDTWEEARSPLARAD